MNKTGLIKHIKATTTLSANTVEKSINTALETIRAALAKGDDITLTGFGNFTVTDRPERQGRNPKTGEAITIAASKQVRFRASRALKEAVA